MKIDYRQGKGISLFFPVSELKVALSILRALYTVSKLDFVMRAIIDIEEDLKPKLLPLVSHNHLCESCFRMVSDQEDNVVHLTGTVDKWKHKICKDLKKNRPN